MAAVVVMAIRSASSMVVWNTRMGEHDEYAVVAAAAVVVAIRQEMTTLQQPLQLRQKKMEMM